MLQSLGWKLIIGLTLLLAAWIDPFGLGRDFQIVAFILGFDLIPLIPKLIMFGVDFFYNITGLSTSLFFMLAEEIILDFFIIGKIINLAIKPAIIFILIAINGLPVFLALAVAAIDFLLNLEKKLI